MIGVAHLVWGPLGPAPLRRFLDAYRARAAGAEHELVILLNGARPEHREPLLHELEAVPHRLLELPQPVQDLGAYRFAAARLEYDRLCFMNSYSEPLVDGWLARLDAALSEPQAGLAGATGSWASLHSAVLNAFLLPNPYRGVVPGRSESRRLMHEIDVQLEVERRGGTGAAEAAEIEARLRGAEALRFRISSTLKALAPMPEQLLRFEPFPAHHLRTNAFIVERELFCSLTVRKLDRKLDAYLMESGRGSFTRQVQGLGLRVLVAGRDGRGYEPDDWPSSATLWQGDQENLLVADNQTRSYALGGYDRRRMLSTFAWADRAEPAAPGGG